MNRIFRVTVARCIGCGKCELACAFGHSADAVPASARIGVVRRGPDAGTPVVCLQCHASACLAVCPSGALTRDDRTGAVAVDDHRCIRCRACVAACPFGCMRWDDSSRAVQKCDLCGGHPRCVPFCPTRALEYVPADQVVSSSR